jgi:hypothetical protein
MTRVSGSKLACSNRRVVFWSWFCAAIKGSIDSSQCRFEYPSVACLNGINRAGRAAKASRMFGSNGVGNKANKEMLIKTGRVVGYKIVAGSNAAGTCMRFRSRRFEGFPRRQE